MSDTARVSTSRARSPAFAALAVVLLLCVCGCVDGGSDVDAQPSSSPTPAASAQATDAPGTATVGTAQPSSTAFLRPTSVISPTAPARPELPEVVEKVVTQASADHAVGRESVTLISYAEATWSSTALGCPEEGRFYAQIVTNGYAVLLEIDGRTVAYHIDERGTSIVNCGEADTVTP